MAAVPLDFWFTSDGNNFVTVSTDEIGVTCRLLARLRKKPMPPTSACFCICNIPAWRL